MKKLKLKNWELHWNPKQQERVEFELEKATLDDVRAFIDTCLGERDGDEFVLCPPDGPVWTFKDCGAADLKVKIEALLNLILEDVTT